MNAFAFSGADASFWNSSAKGGQRLRPISGAGPIASTIVAGSFDHLQVPGDLGLVADAERCRDRLTVELFAFIAAANRAFSMKLKSSRRYFPGLAPQ